MFIFDNYTFKMNYYYVYETHQYIFMYILLATLYVQSNDIYVQLGGWTQMSTPIPWHLIITNKIFKKNRIINKYKFNNNITNSQ